MKKRSILLHMQKINFDFYKFVDVSFRSLLGHFVPLSIALDILIAFLTLGIKAIFRFTYSIMKTHKHFIKTIGCGEEFLNFLRGQTKKDTDQMKLIKHAFKYSLGHNHFDIKKIDIDKIQNEMKAITVDEFQDYIPLGCGTSSIVSYEQFARVWAMLPEHVRIRNPERVYQAHSDGFNIQNLYRVCSEYKNDYKFSIMLI